jgi:putative redox protein
MKIASKAFEGARILAPAHWGITDGVPEMHVQAHLHRAAGSLTSLSNGRHAWSADIAEPLGGSDLAPDPHELLDSALAACTLLTLELYIRRKQLAVTHLAVQVEHVEGKSADGKPLYQLQRKLSVEGELSDAERQRLLEIAARCPIHRLLEGEVRIATEVLA